MKHSSLYVAENIKQNTFIQTVFLYHLCTIFVCHIKEIIVKILSQMRQEFSKFDYVKVSGMTHR